jgi:hypothetical protein
MKKLIVAALLISSFEFQISSYAADIETSGFIDARYGLGITDNSNAETGNLEKLTAKEHRERKKTR